MPPPGPLPGATIPTTVSITGTGGSIYKSDVTGAVNAALNGNMTEINYMITSSLEGPVPVPLPTGSGLDCKTSYDVTLNVTHN